jgi:penicillin-binding protein 1C
LDNARGGPQLLFPPDGAAVLVDGYGPNSRGLALAARGDKLQWYVDGAPLALSNGALSNGPLTNGQTIWRPESPGFYTVAAVDAEGRRVQARVRVR